MGIVKKIEDPETLWSLFEDYKIGVKINPYVVVDYVGKDATPVNRYKEKCFTLEDFELYVATLPGMPWDLDAYFGNANGAYVEFKSIASRIRKEIRADQIRGGMSGLFNASITARLNGLVERSEVRQVVEQPLFGEDVTEL